MTEKDKQTGRRRQRASRRDKAFENQGTAAAAVGGGGRERERGRERQGGTDRDINKPLQRTE